MKKWQQSLGRLWDHLQAPLRRRRQRAEQLAEADRQRDELLQDLAECRRQLQNIDALFNLVGEPEQIESCVYQYRALQARYDGLVRRARQQGLTLPARPRAALPAAPATTAP